MKYWLPTTLLLICGASGCGHPDSPTAAIAPTKAVAPVATSNAKATGEAITLTVKPVVGSVRKYTLKKSLSVGTGKAQSETETMSVKCVGTHEGKFTFITKIINLNSSVKLSPQAAKAVVQNMNSSSLYTLIDGSGRTLTALASGGPSGQEQNVFGSPLGGLLLPSNSVRVGDTWPSEFTIQGIKPLKTTCKLVKIVGSGDHQLAEIALEGLKIPGDEYGKPVVARVSVADGLVTDFTIDVGSKVTAKRIVTVVHRL